MNQLPDGNFIRNTHKTADIVEYYGLAYAFQNCEQNFVSTEFLKLREIRIAYEFPRQLLARSKFIKGLSLSVYGRNLYCWSKFPGWDPEGAFMRGASDSSRNSRCCDARNSDVRRQRKDNFLTEQRDDYENKTDKIFDSRTGCIGDRHNLVFAFRRDEHKPKRRAEYDGHYVRAADRL